MKIIIITSNERFITPKNITCLLKGLKSKNHIIYGQILSASPLNRKKSILSKLLQTINVFGLKFALFYGFLFLKGLLFKTSVKNCFRSEGVPTITLNGDINSDLNISKLLEIEPDLIISILGNQIYKDRLLSLPKFGCINLHTSLLPKYRGVMPTFWALKNNEQEIGVTVFLMDKGIDSGPILNQSKMEIKNGETQYSLIKKTKKIGMKLILETVDLINQNNVIFKENDSNLSTYYSFPKKEDVMSFLNDGKKFF